MAKGKEGRRKYSTHKGRKEIGRAGNKGMRRKMKCDKSKHRKRGRKQEIKRGNYERNERK